MSDRIRQYRLPLLIVAILVLVLAADFSQRVMLSETTDKTVIESDRVSLDVSGGNRTSPAPLEQALAKLQPPAPKKNDNETVKPKPKKPKGPTKEEQLQGLVDGGAKRLGADVVYLRGILVDKKQYALLVLVDKDLKQRSQTLQVGDTLGSYTLAKIDGASVVFASDGESIQLKLFEKSRSGK